MPSVLVDDSNVALALWDSFFNTHTPTDSERAQIAMGGQVLQCRAKVLSADFLPLMHLVARQATAHSGGHCHQHQLE